MLLLLATCKYVVVLYIGDSSVRGLFYGSSLQNFASMGGGVGTSSNPYPFFIVVTMLPTLNENNVGIAK